MEQEFVVEVGITERLPIYKSSPTTETPTSHEDEVEPSAENAEVLFVRRLFWV